MAVLLESAPGAVLRRFFLSRRAGAATEFALVGLWAIGLMLVILNLALLSFSLGALAHGTQAAARQAVVTAANSNISNTSTSGTVTTQTFSSCPSADAIAGYFRSYTAGALPSAGTASGSSNPYVNSSWNNSSTLGLYVTVSGTYVWRPTGFNLLSSNGITLKISTWATVPGSISSNATYYAVSVSGTC